MSADLLLKLDAFRAEWGDQVAISTAPGGLGRKVEDGHGGAASQHNMLRWGEVRAVDVHPRGIYGPDDFARAVDIAESVGFTGIGVYPDWNRPGVHLDVRDAVTVAKWAGVFRDGKQAYVGINTVVG